jgi:Ca2+-binding RTX toxin-like protein
LTDGIEEGITDYLELSDNSVLFYFSIPQWTGCPADSCGYTFKILPDFTLSEIKLVDTHNWFTMQGLLLNSGGNSVFLLQDRLNNSNWLSLSTTGAAIGEPSEVSNLSSDGGGGQRSLASISGKVAMVYSDWFQNRSGANVYINIYRKISRGLVINDGNSGNRLIGSTVFGDTLNGNRGNDVLVGRGGADTLNGGLGKDKLFGGEGPDVMAGGPDADEFILDATPDRTNADTIRDFNATEADKLVVDSAAYAGTQAGRPVLLTTTRPTGLFATFIYHRSVGALYFDPDGTGPRPRTKSANFPNKPNLLRTHFVVR